MNHIVEHIDKYIQFMYFYRMAIAALFVMVVFFFATGVVILNRGHAAKLEVVSINDEAQMEQYRVYFGIQPPRRKWFGKRFVHFVKSKL